MATARTPSKLFFKEKGCLKVEEEADSRTLVHVGERDGSKGAHVANLEKTFIKTGSAPAAFSELLLLDGTQQPHIRSLKELVGGKRNQGLCMSNQLSGRWVGKVGMLGL